MNYVHDEVGTAKVYAGVSAAVCGYMSVDAEDSDCYMDESDWAEDIREDYRRRGNNSSVRN